MYDILSYNQVVSSSDYSLSLGLPGSGGGQTAFGYLTLSTPFKFNTADLAQAATYKQEVNDSIASNNGNLSVQIGPYTVLIPAVIPPAAVTPPATNSAPSNLTATMSTTNIGQINLTWTAGGPTPIAGYVIERSFSGTAGPFTLVGTTSASVTSYTDDLTGSTIGGVSETYRIRSVSVIGTFSNYTNMSTVSNCVSLGGSGPRKIVFMRGGNWNYNGSTTLDYFIGKFNDIINDGFKFIDPYKTYFNQFSFYVDLASYNSNGLLSMKDPSTGHNMVNMSDDYSVTLNRNLSSSVRPSMRILIFILKILSILVGFQYTLCELMVL